MGKNIIQKIWDTHVVTQQEGHPAIFAIDFMLIHEVTSAQAFEVLERKKIPVFDTSRLLATLDHSIPTRKDRWVIYDESAQKQVEKLRNNAKNHGVKLFDFESGHQGIVHVIGPELGIIQPGMTLVCGDSHTATLGAFGALAFGIGTTEVGYVLATNCILQQPSKTMKVEFRGSFNPGVFAKDAILRLIANIGVGGANGHTIEYVGDAIRAMTMEERMTVCNMSIECGARAGLVSPDEKTFEFIKGRPCAPKSEAWERAVKRWKSFASDPDATYDKSHSINVSELLPMVTWGTNPAQALPIDGKIPFLKDVPENIQISVKEALDYTKLQQGSSIEGTPVDYAFIGSCTNGRIDDFRVAAKIVEGKKISSAVTMLVVPGSEAVREQMKAEGLDRIFTEAGADVRNPGCSMCLGMNDDKVPAGKRCISSSNRNFVGRQGQGSYTHLASPATVAASAINGRITSPQQYL